ncbi:DNA-processing protein DprA [Propionicicella superfundia]|uniref:DNA-processing protein DprA n=1 Tax=Propionicicella superfundia TaxID=348582 RepID=UPI000423497D|nr:DNA-processing protein DprA [Propionicicella superfundia]
MEEREARMALSCVVDPGDPQAAALVGEFGAVEVWQAVLRGSPERWAARAASVSLGEVERFARVKGIRFVTPGEDEWPERLAGLSGAEPLADRGGPPLGLWLRGPADPVELCGRAVAIVGSRAATAYGRTVAGDIAAEVGVEGMTVVSGGAYGVDAAAHRGALGGGAATVAVLACGLDRVYPAGNAALLEQIRSAHLLVSELPPGAHPTRIGFLARNRLIAALAQGTVLVEAAVRSGARNTASWTTRLGRVLMAVPGSVLSAASVTPNRLIREQEAVLVTSALDVIAELGPLDGRQPPLLDVRATWDDLDAGQRAVVDALPARASRTSAELAVASGLPYGACLGSLGVLADRGIVEPTDSGEWRLAVARGRAGARHAGAGAVPGAAPAHPSRADGEEAP